LDNESKKDDGKRTVSDDALHNVKDIPSTANVNRMMNEARLEEERKARPPRNPNKSDDEAKRSD